MRETRAVPTPDTLAEWVNADRCPLEALLEATRLFVELRQRTPKDPRLAATLVALRTKLGTDVQWGDAESGGGHTLVELPDSEDADVPEYASPVALRALDHVALRALDHIEVNADSIVCLWRPWASREGPAHPTDLSDMADWWNSIPLAERPIEADLDDLQPLDRKYESSLDSLVTQWYDTPERERPKHFPLDPIVQAWMKSRDPDSPVLNAGDQSDGEVSLHDYIPHWQRYQRDVRRAVEKDAKEMNGQDVHTAFERANADQEKYGELRRENEVDLLIGLLRAADCEEHRRDCPLQQQAPEVIKRLIAGLGRLGDVDHGRVERAFDYALGGGKKYGDLHNMYRRRRRRTD